MGDDEMSTNYAIIQANFNPDESVYTQRTKACRNFNKKYMENTTVPDENFLVLWNNVTLSAELGHSTEDLLTIFSKERLLPATKGLSIKSPN